MTLKTAAKDMQEIFH